ncbi:hypothetical protein D3C87_1581180 [compost metagenome]
MQFVIQSGNGMAIEAGKLQVFFNFAGFEQIKIAQFDQPLRLLCGCFRLLQFRFQLPQARNLIVTLRACRLGHNRQCYCQSIHVFFHETPICLLMPSFFIFEPNVVAGIARTFAAPFSPLILPSHAFNTAIMWSRSFSKMFLNVRSGVFTSSLGALLAGRDI